MDAAGTEATRADPDPTGRAVHDGPDLLKIGFPAPVGFNIRMAYLVAVLFGLTADGALSGHDGFPLSRKMDVLNFSTRPRRTQGNEFFDLFSAGKIHGQGNGIFPHNPGEKEIAGGSRTKTSGGLRTFGRKGEAEWRSLRIHLF